MGKKPNIPLHFVGLGGAGCNVLADIYAKGIQAKYTCISHHGRPHLPDEINPGQQVGSIASLHSGTSDIKVPLLLTEEVKENFNKDDHYILLAGLGGYAGIKMVEQLIHWLQKHDKNFTAICSMPFAFEGERRLHAPIIVDKFKLLPNFKYFDLEAVREKYGKQILKATNEEFWLLFKQILPEI